MIRWKEFIVSLYRYLHIKGIISLKFLIWGYDEKIYDEKCDVVYYHIYENYFGAEQSVYTQV